MELEVGQIWISEDSPHENFEIYDVIEQEWDNHPKEVFYCWKRTNIKEFNEFVAIKKGMSLEDFEKSTKTTFPYAWCGESKKSSISAKIKKNNMRLVSA